MIEAILIICKRNFSDEKIVLSKTYANIGGEGRWLRP